jgi:hypothetical protein
MWLVVRVKLNGHQLMVTRAETAEKEAGIPRTARAKQLCPRRNGASSARDLET